MNLMEIYLDANATTHVLEAARAAALTAMADGFGNPSSVHTTGLRARAMLEGVRQCARRILSLPSGQVVFTSGATEGIQTAVLSALNALRARRTDGGSAPDLLLYGATEHKAVPEALNHWNDLFNLGLSVEAIPVGRDGRHDLDWLRARAPRAGLVCTMAVNNETGVISDLDGIAAAMVNSPALWLVDSVQALGKLDLRLDERRIDYAPFSGHKLYATKGIGLLYVREDAPFTALLAGGGQEASHRSGTENMPGIAALGAVLAAIESGNVFHDRATLDGYRERLTVELQRAFPGMVLNAPPGVCVPTTLNFSVPGVSAKLMLDLFDAAGMRISGGAACSAAKPQASHVLGAMGLPQWQAASAVRLSFGTAVSEDFIDEACTRIRACGDSLRLSCLVHTPENRLPAAERITRFTVDGTCCYLLADAASRRCVVIDPLPELHERLIGWVNCQGYALVAVLDTHSHGDHVSSANLLRASVALPLQGSGNVDDLGWPAGAESIDLGSARLSRLAIPGHTEDSTAYLLHEGDALRFAFVGDTVMPGALGRSDFPHSAPTSFGRSLRALESVVGPHGLMLPSHDYEDCFAATLTTERAAQPLLASLLHGELDDSQFVTAKAQLERDLQQSASDHNTMVCGARVGSRCAETPEIDANAMATLLRHHPDLLLVDVREPFEQRLGGTPRLGDSLRRQAVALSNLVNALPDWLALPPETPVVFFCRSGNRSTLAARALRRLGHAHSWSLAGGLALWHQNTVGH